MKNLHLFENTTFTEPYINFVNINFNSNEHLFLIIEKENRTAIKPRNNVKGISKNMGSMSIILKEMYKSDKIILHGLFLTELVIMLFFQPWLLKKCYWVVWGGDLYYYQHRIRSFKSNVNEYIRAFVIKRLGGIITHVKGDYDLAKQWYGVTGKYYYSFMYLSNLYKEYDLSKVKKDKSEVYIQVGNSASPANNHIEIFKRLQKYKEKPIKVICPLSYGNTNYSEKVIKEGKRFFGENFMAITEFIPFENYLELLAKIDIAIFNHNRQQALGNITTLLGLGKKVYIRDDITTWQFCLDHNLKVYRINNTPFELFEEMTNREKRNNIESVNKNFSEKKLKEDLEIIFND